jgi:TolA protein
MRTGFTISTAGHLVLLAWGLVTFSSKPFEAAESVPVDVISESEFSQIMAGSKMAQKADKPKPLVDKVAEPKEIKDPTPKVSDKPEIMPEQQAQAEPKPPEPKPEAKPPEPKAQAQSEPPPKPAEPAVDPIAEALKKEEAKRKEEAKKLEEAKKKEEAKKREEARKREEAKKREALKFDEAKIENRLALLDKRTAQRQAATGATVNQTASLGAPTGTAMTLSQSELDALRAQIQACWSPPAGVADAKDLIVVVHLLLKQDGSLAAEPAVTNRSSNPLFRVAAESATRAIRRCQPYRLPIAKYEVWKDVEVNFDPRDMFRG